jgi:NADPH:quinone reductase-like Zn-dependent oxidoreductase
MPVPEPGPNQVRVRMLASPINPSDLLTVRGQYGATAQLPATPGYEGVGVVDAVGPGLIGLVRGLRRGRRVAVPSGLGGNWGEYAVLPARQAVPVPHDIPDEQAACFFVNPATVVAMLERVLRVRRGDWVLQTAAASALGKMVIRLGKHRGFRTINVVRRPEQAGELRQLGADEVIATASEHVEERVRQITAGRGVPFALDAVGGSMGLDAVRSLGQRGRLLVYGTLSGEPIAIEPRHLIAGQKRVEGFWLSEWVREQGVWTLLKLFREIFALMRAGVLVTPVLATYPLEEIQAAVREAEKTGRTGKVLLKMSR